MVLRHSNRKATVLDDDHREHHTRCRRNLHLRHWLCLYCSEITCDINSLWEWMHKAFLHWQNLNIECKLLTLSDYYSDMQKRLINQKIKAAFSFDKNCPFLLFSWQEKTSFTGSYYQSHILRVSVHTTSHAASGIFWTKPQKTGHLVLFQYMQIYSKPQELEEIWHAAKVQSQLNKLKWWVLSIRKLPTQGSMVMLLILVISRAKFQWF